jgi:Peptidase_C39 like family
MIILLVTILVIALCFIVAGLLLSPKSSAPPPRSVSYAARNGSGVRRTGQQPPVRRTSQQPPMRRTSQITRRPYLEVEPEPWTGFVSSLNVARIFRSSPGDKGPWVGLTLILLAIFCFSLLLFRTFLPSSGMLVATSWPDAATAATPPVANASASNVKASPFASLSGASKALVRLNQLDPVQYNSQQDFNTWAYSACSSAAMTVVINSYGHNYRIADILKVEAGLHEITPDQGLLEPTGIDHTVAKFGFKTYWISNTSLDNVIKVANQGHPVIVGFPPALWSGGHLLVVRGGDSQSVYLADSSRLNMQVMARATFMKYWGGFAVVPLPE